MPRSFEEVRQIAIELPVEEQVLLANVLFDNAAAADTEASNAEIIAAWENEIKRRLDEIDSGVVELVPGEQVRAEMIEGLSPQACTRLGL